MSAVPLEGLAYTAVLLLSSGLLGYAVAEKSTRLFWIGLVADCVVSGIVLIPVALTGMSLYLLLVIVGIVLPWLVGGLVSRLQRNRQ